MDTPLSPSATPASRAFADHLDLMFGTGGRLVKDEPHVKVWRCAEGSARYFRKQYLRYGDIDLSFWTHREFTLLNELKSRRLGHVQQYRGIRDLGPEGQQLETWDAGPDGDQWQQVPVARDGHRLAHPFMECGHWFGLGRWLLAALDEMHALGFVHVDLKADNFCLPTQSLGTAGDGYPDRIRLQWDELKLIDFAFSLWEKRLPLDEDNPLPIGRSAFRYQSEQLLAALGTKHSPPAPDLDLMRKLDWRVDLYSLGFVLGQVLREVEKRCLPEDGNWGWTEKRRDQGRQLLDSLQGWDRGWERPAPTERPHGALIELLDRLLGEDDLAASLAGEWKIARDANWRPQDASVRTPPTVPALRRRGAARSPAPVAPSPVPPPKPAPASPPPSPPLKKGGEGGFRTDEGAKNPPRPPFLKGGSAWLLVLIVGAALGAGAYAVWKEGQHPPPAPRPEPAPPPAPVVVTPPAEPRTYLTVRATPASAQIRIMNIGPAYRDGIELAPGDFDLQVSAPGYQTYRAWHTLAAGTREVAITLQPAAPEHPAFEVFRDRLSDGTRGPAMVVIPGGEFQMGSPANEPERNSDERQHGVRVASFAMGQYEVTFEEYDRFCAATGREKPSDDRGWGRDRRPVINVNWNDAMAYAEWLSQQTGKQYRLPTEAEWEYAARAGMTTPFWTGRCVTTDQANYDGNYGYGSPDCGAKTGVYRQKTLPVDSLQPNPWKLYGTMGNVWEWTCSQYAKDYDGPELKCAEKDTDGSRVLRGGSWGSGPEWLRSAARNLYIPRTGNDNAGFRLARTL
ncbi:MAG: SUMF1/EgtB/PvdO family nonheme iron enzyme [Candidatus Contendobacter sp.]|nr:SUMF1/EgtB/PvdO family nonheme iron enzyme [Candidatus Contendobacter sp.]